MENVLKVGEKYTLLGVSDTFAATYKQHIKITQFINGKPIFSEKGKGNCMKKKQYQLTLKKDVLIFEGWDLPFKITSEISVDTGRGYSQTSYVMNAMLNIVGDRETVKEYIDNKNLNPEFTRKDFILVWDTNYTGSTSKNELLYPEAETTSKMVESLR